MDSGLPVPAAWRARGFHDSMLVPGFFDASHVQLFEDLAAFTAEHLSDRRRPEGSLGSMPPVVDFFFGGGSTPRVFCFGGVKAPCCFFWEGSKPRVFLGGVKAPCFSVCLFWGGSFEGKRDNSHFWGVSHS